MDISKFDILVRAIVRGDSQEEEVSATSPVSIIYLKELLIKEFPWKNNPFDYEEHLKYEITNNCKQYPLGGYFDYTIGIKITGEFVETNYGRETDAGIEIRIIHHFKYETINDIEEIYNFYYNQINLKLQLPKI